MKTVLSLFLLAVALSVNAIDPKDAGKFEFSEGGIIRGPKSQKKIALVFTGHTFAEGGKTILDELHKRDLKASFFLTGDFLENNKSLVKRIVREGHYVGPHSDKHLLYCPWEGPKKTLISRGEFESDLDLNLKKIEKFGVPRKQIKYWLPPYEWYNQDIVEWGKAMGLLLVNYTPGTRSNADYLPDNAKNFISSEAIFDSIVKREREAPDGLNGFLLLMHLGAGPERKDKMHKQLGELIDYLSSEGYEFVRVDELLKTK